MEAVLVVIILILLGMLFFNNKAVNKKHTSTLERNAVLAQTVLDLEKDTNNYIKALDEERNKFNRYQHITKARDVKFGQQAETLLPFLEGFPYNPSDCRFLGMPIDLIVFSYDTAEIIFLEVKTGKAQESKRQKLIKNAIKMGKVYYEQVRIDEHGMSIKREKNLDEEAEELKDNEQT